MQNEPNDRVPVPPAVLDGIEAVRRSGATNMLDRPRVAQLCDELGHYDAALWVSEKRELYARGIFHGFRGGEEESADEERRASDDQELADREGLDA